MAKLIGRKVDDSPISQKILLLQKVLTSKKNLVRVYCITFGKEVIYFIPNYIYFAVKGDS